MANPQRIEHIRIESARIHDDNAVLEDVFEHTLVNPTRLPDVIQAYTHESVEAIHGFLDYVLVDFIKINFSAVYILLLSVWHDNETDIIHACFPCARYRLRAQCETSPVPFVSGLESIRSLLSEAGRARN